MKFIKPVLIQKLEDEYDLTDGIAVNIHAVAGQVLIKGNDSDTVSGALVNKYRSATATCMFVMQWSRPDIYNAVCSLAHHMRYLRRLIQRYSRHW